MDRHSSLPCTLKLTQPNNIKCKNKNWRGTKEVDYMVQGYMDLVKMKLRMNNILKIHRRGWRHIILGDRLTGVK